MTNMLAAADRNKLLKVLGLLASDQPGEVVSAGAAACRLLRERGLDWSQVLSGNPTPSPCPHTAAETAAGLYRPDIVWLQRRADRLTPWEATFIQSVSRRTRLTEKQLATLRKIVREVMVREVAR